MWQNVAGKNSNGTPTSAQENNKLFVSLLVTGQKNVLAKIPRATTATPPPPIPLPALVQIKKLEISLILSPNT